jgi:hypothetical protein
MPEYGADQIVAFIKSGSGPAGMFSAHDAAKNLADSHKKIADKMLRLEGKMDGSWKGDAAQQAQAGVRPLVAASDVSAAHLSDAQNLYFGQGNSFVDLKNKVGDGPGTKPESNFLNDITPYHTSLDSSIDQYNQKSQAVVDSYAVYHGQSTDNSGRWPEDYGQLGALPSGTDVVPNTDIGSGPGGPGPSLYNGPHKPSGEHYPANGPGQQGNPGSPPVVPVQHGPGHGAPNDVNSGSQPLSPGKSSGSGTQAAGYLPPNVSSPSDSGFGPGAGRPGGFSSGAGGFGPGVMGGFGPGGGSGGGAGYAGSGSGSGGSRAGGQLGAGKGSGAGASGEPVSNSGRMGGATAAPGARGASGSSGMPGAGKQGKREDDAEHRRPEYLIEPDPENALIGELPKTAPPVIGL